MLFWSLDYYMICLSFKWSERWRSNENRVEEIQGLHLFSAMPITHTFHIISLITKTNLSFCFLFWGWQPSWSKLAVRKWLNIKSSSHKFHSEYSVTGETPSFYDCASFSVWVEFLFHFMKLRVSFHYFRHCDRKEKELFRPR